MAEKEFGPRLKELRRERNLTQQKLADRTGVDFTYISKLETGRAPPPKEKTLLALAEALGADPDEFYGLARRFPSRWASRLDPDLARKLRSILEGDGRQGAIRGPRRPQTTPFGAAHPEARFRSIVENLGDGVMIMNSDLEVIYENPGCARMLGYYPGRLGGRDPLSIVHADDITRLGKGFTGLLREPGGTARTIARIKHADGAWRLIEAVAVNRLNDPAVAGILLTFRDVTDRGREEEERTRGAAVRETAHKFVLTDTEKQVLALVVEGKSNRQIGERLVTSPSTVKFHVGNILGKLGARNRMEIVAQVLSLRPVA